MRIGLVVLGFFWSLNAGAQFLSNGVPSAAVGAYGTILTHEGGHALTALVMGKEVDLFRPFPSQIPWQTEDGKIENKWTLGVVRIRTDGMNSREAGWFAAMGSGANSLGVLLLSPLLPSVSGFGAQALDDYLAIASLDMVSYTFVDLVGLTGGTGDWSQVSKATGVGKIWWFAGAAVESVLLNQYRLAWRNKSPSDGILRKSKSVVGVSFSF